MKSSAGALSHKCDKVKQILCGFAIERQPASHYRSFYGTAGSIETDRYNEGNNLKAYFRDDPDSNTLKDVPVDFERFRLPPGAKSGGHGVAEYYMVDDFVRSIFDDTKPAIDVYEGLDYTVPGLCAHISAQRGGEPVEVADFRP